MDLVDRDLQRTDVVAGDIVDANTQEVIALHRHCDLLLTFRL